MVNLDKVPAKLDPMRDSFNVQEGMARLLGVATLQPTRQLIRQYLRAVAYIHMTNSFPGESRKVRRKMAFRLATRSQFISEVSRAKAIR